MEYFGHTTEEMAVQLADRPHSVGEMLRQRAAKTPDKLALTYPDKDEHWHELTWAQTQERAHDLAAGLLALGLQPEERVSIACSTRVEWLLADFAVMCARGATTTVYPSTKPHDVAYIMRDSETKYAVVENLEQLEKIRAFPEIYDALQAIVLIEGWTHDDKTITFEELEAKGREHRAANPGIVDAAIDQIQPDDLSTLIYTSGTTGQPKGVMLNQDAWSYEAKAVEMLGLVQDDDLLYLWLPLSHVFGKCVAACLVQVGAACAVDGRIDKIVDNLQVIRPTLMTGAPRIFEKVRAKVMVGNQTGLKSKIARWAFKIGMEAIPYTSTGKPMPKAMAARYRIADKLVFAKLKAAMGGRMRFMVSGSAKLNAQVQNWFAAAGLVIVEGYGSTETSAITFLNVPQQVRFGTVGPIMPGSQVRIDEDGEILVKGPGVTKCYFKRPDLTAEAFTEDGFFRTGDIGELDDENNLRITDRKKDLIKTSGGKFVAPQKVESALVANCPYLSQVVAFGEGRKYISALVSLDPQAIAGWSASHNNGELKDLSYTELCRHRDVKSMIERWVEKGNGRLERWETVKRFAILDSELNADDGAVTPSLKIRRQQVADLHGDLIDSLYDPED